MRRVSCLTAFAACLLGSVSIAEADEVRLDDQQLDEVTAGSFFGIGDFLDGLPGEGIGLPQDIPAVFPNPEFGDIGGIQFPDDVFDFLEGVGFPDDVFGIVNGIFQPNPE